MKGIRFFRFWMVFGLVCASGVAVRAAPPWGDLVSFKSVDADPEKTYPITESNGPWMIMTCSFSGDGAEKQAKQLAYELRKRYKLPAYLYLGHFDPGEAQVRGLDKFGNPRKGVYWKYKDAKDKDKARHPELTEFAVLVGNYPSADDAEAQETLQKIRFAKPVCLEVKDGQATHQTLTGWRMAQRQIYEAMGSAKKNRGPMGHAFVTTNPLLPPDYFTQRGLDDMVVAMNKDVPYSLFDCPGKYTVQVATFKGKVIIKQNEIKDIEAGKQMESELATAAQKADSLTKALRMKGYEAYQFHDRYASIVTIGNFNSVGTPRDDGRIEINPEIHKIMTTFGADPKAGAAVQNALKASGLDKQTMAMPVKSLIGIPFDIQAIPVEVPKRSISVARRSE